MPVEDPNSGRLFVWVTTCILFVFIAIGGLFLLLYLVLPPNPYSEWLPVAGVALVCLPWLFWFLTCFYRIISRALGFRFAIGFGDVAGGGGDGGGRPRSASFNNTAEINVSSFDPTNCEEGHSHKGDGRSTNKRGLTQTNSSNDISVKSHESEMPLASSMAS